MRTEDVTRRRTGTTVLAIGAFLGLATGSGCDVRTLPAPRGPRTAPPAAEEAAVERQPVCIGSSVASAGTLGDTLYYREERLDDGRIAVGYFAFWSEERPWGNNWLTWSVLPAAVVDAVYSRALFVAPGLQRVLYGPGDVEGVTVVYDERADGTLEVHHAVADGDDERPLTLLRDEVLAIDPARPTFYADNWSHQLGARGARSPNDLSYVRCYEGDAVRPLTAAIDHDFHLANRAGPAHVERWPGRASADQRVAEEQKGGAR